MSTFRKHILFLWIPVVLSCSGNSNEKVAEVAEKSDSLVIVSNAQFEAMKMQLGDAKKAKFNEVITAQGVIEPKPDGLAQVTSPINGIVKSIRFSPSAKVYKGQVIITIEGPEIINLQTMFVEAYNQYKVARANFERLSNLAGESFTSKKELEQAEGEYRILEAKKESYALLLKRLGLKVENVLNGQLSDEAFLYSPIDGVVTKSYVSLGKSVNTNEPLAELINVQSLQLKFYAFMEQVVNLKPGQRVDILIPQEKKILRGTVTLVGADANTENRAVECYASIDDRAGLDLVSGMLVHVKVYTNSIEGWALPASALQIINDRNIAYMLDSRDSTGYKFKMHALQTGLVSDSIVQVFDSTLRNVLVKGGYELTLTE